MFATFPRLSILQCLDSRRDSIVALHTFSHATEISIPASPASPTLGFAGYDVYFDLFLASLLRIFDYSCLIPRKLSFSNRCWF